MDWNSDKSLNNEIAKLQNKFEGSADNELKLLYTQMIVNLQQDQIERLQVRIMNLQHRLDLAF
jgi:hypothetical protein